MQKENKLLKGFFELQPDYRPATMWFCGDDLKEDEITAQLEGFKSKGINDFFVNHTAGATDDYLGERYFEAIKHMVKEAKRLGLSFWIYDEYEYPSGLVGGYLLRDRPDLRARVLCDTRKYLVPGHKFNRIYVKGNFISASRVLVGFEEDGAEDVTDLIEIEPAGDGFYFTYKHDYCGSAILHVMSERLQDYNLSASVGAKFSFWQDGYIDALREEGIRAFMDYTHEKYKAAIGDEFGKTVKGLFTDEVCVGTPQDLGVGRVPWNYELVDRFKARFGYDMTPWLYALLETPVTEKEKQVRYHFWRLLTERVRDAHIKQVYEWCTKENLLYTGHFDGEESMVWSMYQSGDIFDLMEWMHVPGIDSIFSRTKIEEEAFNVAGKILSSCSKFYGRDRTLCETYTGSSFKLRFNEMRRIANRLMMLGVNMIQYMGAHYSMDNQRKSWKPSFNYNNTMFERFDLFGDYVSRIQYVSAQTKTAGRVLFMCPQSSVYTNFDGQGPIFGAITKYDMAMWGLVNSLLEMNVEYDIFSDSLASKFDVSDGSARLFGVKYDTVILPCVDDTTSEVIEMIEKLRSVGVKLVFIDELPKLLVDKGCESAPYGTKPESGDVCKIGDNMYYLAEQQDDKQRGKNANFKNKLWQVLGEEYRTLDIKHNGTIYTSERTDGNQKVYFLTNDKEETTVANIACNENMQLLDPLTGKACPLNIVDGRADITFGPLQFYILLSEKDEAIEDCKTIASEPFKTVDAACDFKAASGNILNAQWKIASYDGSADEPIVVPDVDTMMQLGVEGDVPSKYAKINAVDVLVYDFDVDYIPETVTLFAEDKYVLRCELNGVRIDKDWQHCRLWGPNDSSIEVASLLKKGANRLTAVVAVQEFATGFFMPFLQFRGDFEVDGNKMCAKRESYTAAPINEQGHKRVCGSGTYTFKANLTKEEAAQTVAVSVASNDAVELIVNGKSAGVCL
ncbi:MAG: hypothetical protein IJF27_04975, partial [Oscillospiraceae bacterium]|nr:hypothetical protein [Oscillospiraceae bacterium]